MSTLSYMGNVLGATFVAIVVVLLVAWLITGSLAAGGGAAAVAALVVGALGAALASRYVRD